MGNEWESWKSSRWRILSGDGGSTWTVRNTETGEEKKVCTANWGDTEELGEKISQGEFEKDD